jgi:uncharacterized FlgJ-related protein
LSGKRRTPWPRKRRRRKKKLKKPRRDPVAVAAAADFMNTQNGKEEKKKGFFAKLVEKLDKKLAEKANKSGCGCKSEKDKGNSCCG